MLQYITLNKALEKLALGDKITFHFPNETTFQNEISLGNTGYYCFPYLEIFEKLEIYDANTFVREIVGYDCRGLWPEVKTLDDFKKVIKALDDECIKKWGALDTNTSQLKVGDKVKILPRNGSQEDYYPQYVDGMLKYVGQLATITQVMKTSCNIDLDDSSYYWPFKALQLVTSETDKTVDPDELKNGDYIKITNSLKVTYIYIFKKIKDGKIYRHVSYHLNSKAIIIDPNISWLFTRTTKITYATEEERRLLNNALLKEGFIWDDLTKQLKSVGEANVSLTNTYSTGINVQPLNLSSIQASIQNFYDYTKLLNHTKEEPQTETELNLFPTKKHYQLNFNY